MAKYQCQVKNKGFTRVYVKTCYKLNQNVNYTGKVKDRMIVEFFFFLFLLEFILLYKRNYSLCNTKFTNITTLFLKKKITHLDIK